MSVAPGGDFLIVLLMSIGALLMLIAAIGLVRMPDLFLRISASSKGATLGVVALMLATALHFGDLGVTSRTVAVSIFMLLTAPVAAHMAGRAAYKDGARFWERTVLDEQIEQPVLQHIKNLVPDQPPIERRGSQ